MPENKFDLNKALQAAKLYTPIDYRIQVPQLSAMRNFENWRTDQGYKTEKEKQKEFEDNIKAMQERTVGLSDADSATDWYHAMETNPVKRAEWDRQAAAVTGHGIGAIATIASAGTMGWIPSLISTGTGYAGGYGGYKLGEAIDNRYGTNTAPWLSLIGGFTGGMGGYKGLIKAGNAGLLGTSPYTHLLNGRQNLAYGSQFTKNLVDDIATTSLRKYIPTYGTVKYYGPTMGKTTAAKSNPNLVDFDDYVRPELEQLASELGMTRQQLMMSQDPTVREKARQLMLKSVDGWKKNASNDGKTLVISKSDILQDPIFDNQPLVLQRNEFLKRNAARGETDIQNSLDWYASTRRKGEGKLMEWPDSEGVYISELEPFTPDPHHITFAPQPSKKGSYAFFERPSTYFKNATYAGTPGTYAGKEVPIWQLPKGQRNQPHNPTATERVFSVLGRDPNIPTEGVTNVEFGSGVFPENQLYPMYKFLQKHGVDTKNLTLGDLENLYGRRLDTIRKTSNGDYNLAIPQGTEALPRQWEIRAFDPEGLVGEMIINGPTRKHPDMLPEVWEKYQRFRPGSSVDMVRNATRADGTSMYHPKYGWYTAEIPTRTPVSGVSQRMYDAGIPTAQQTNNGRGLMSGEIYLQPQRSTAVMEHYPTKQIIRNNGEWHWENLDPTKVTTRDNPVYLLTQPSGRYKHIPTKSTLFFPSVIKDGQITTNVNHGSIFLEDGGKL